MGLDVSVYQLLKPCTAELAEAGGHSHRTLWVTQEQLQKLQKIWPEIAAVPNEYLNSERLAKDQNIPENFYLDTWDFSIERGWASYVDNDDKLPNILVEVDSKDYLETQDEFEVYFEVDYTGHLRKPFRGSDSSATVQGDTLTLSVINYDDTVEAKMTELVGKQALDRCYALLTFEDMKKLEELGQLCEDPDYWNQMIIGHMTDDLCVTVIDW